MPKYRKLHVKTTESLDVNDMPDDFTRLLWVLLPLGLCREGRGIDSSAWIRSKIFPLREDINNGMIDDAMSWYELRGMIVRYTVDGRNYFYLPSFEKHQGNTSKEAESNYPPPSRATQELLQSSSGVSKTDVEVTASASTYESESKEEKLSTGEVGKLMDAFVNATGIPEFGMKPRDIEAGQKMVKAGVTPDILTEAIKELKAKKYQMVGLASVEVASYSVMSRNRDGPDPRNIPTEEY